MSAPAPRRSLLSRIGWRLGVRWFGEPYEVYRLRAFPGYLHDILGHKMYQSADDAGVNLAPLQFAAEEHFEFGEIGALRRFVKPGDVVLDLGANIGFLTCLFARHVGPRGHVYAFEPGPLSHALLNANIIVNGYTDRVTAENKAVGDASGSLNLYLCPTGESDNRVGAALSFPGESRQVLPIEVVRLDDYLGRRGVRRVDYVKMDIQGSEAAALRGLEHTLRANPGIKLQVEFSCTWLKQRDESPDAMLDGLESMGFSCHLLDERGPMRSLARSELLHRYSEAAANLLFFRE